MQKLIGYIAGAFLLVVSFGPAHALAAGNLVPSGYDLTIAGDATWGAALIGNSVGFSDQISNNAFLTTAGASTVALQKADSSSGANATTVGTVAISSISYGSSRTATINYTMPTSDSSTTKYFRMCADTYNVVSESNETDNCGPWTTVPIYSSGRADLYSYWYTNPTPTVGSPTMFSTMIINGSIDTVSGPGYTNFPMLLQFASSSSGTNAWDAATDVHNHLNYGVGTSVYLYYTFNSGDVGKNIYWRICADKAYASDPGTVTEGYEGNNCSAWTSQVIATAAPTATLTASPSNALRGSDVALTWSSSNAGSCTSTNFATGGATSGTVSVNATSSSMTFSMTCTGPISPAVNKTVTVTSYTQANLTAHSFSVPTTTANISGTAFTVSGSISNQGSATASNFPYVIQQSGVGAIGTASTISSLAAGATTTVSKSVTISTPGTYQLRLCADLNTSGTGSVTESDETNNCSAWTNVTVVATAPDLQATGLNATYQGAWIWTQPSSVSQTVGIPLALSAIVYNTGAAGTTVFANTFDLVDQFGSHIYVPAKTLVLAAGQYGTTTASYNLGFAFNGSARLCADSNSSVPETDESNNCGPWVTVQGALGSSAAVTCSALPASGGTYQTNTNITWDPTATGFSGTPTYSWSDSYATPSTYSGTSPNENFTTQYAVGNGNSYSPYVSATSGGTTATAYCSPITINTASCAGGTPTVDIKANGLDGVRVTTGSSVAVTWTGTNIQSGTCSVTGTDGYSGGPYSPDTSQPQCAIANGSTNRTVTTQTKYTITCTNGATDTVIVNVVPSFKLY